MNAPPTSGRCSIKNAKAPVFAGAFFCCPCALVIAALPAVHQLVEPWTTASTGRAESVCVAGDAPGALGALGLGEARIVEITAEEAIASLGWAGASGGAHGRRRGMAIGRFSAWWVLGAIGDLHDDWPPTGDDVAELLDDLRWYRWDAHEPVGGWRLQLVVEDRSERLAWALNAADGAV